MLDEKKEAIRRKLHETRSTLLDVARELDQEEWTHPVYTHDGDWTALDLLRHLTWAEGGMLRLMEQIRAGGEGASPDFDVNRYNASGVRKLSNKIPAELMQLMEQNRNGVLRFIDDLNEADMSKKGRHGGSLRIMTIEEILNMIADHERKHTEDLRRALGHI